MMKMAPFDEKAGMVIAVPSYFREVSASDDELVIEGKPPDSGYRIDQYVRIHLRRNGQFFDHLCTVVKKWTYGPDYGVGAAGKRRTSSARCRSDRVVAGLAEGNV